MELLKIVVDMISTQEQSSTVTNREMGGNRAFGNDDGGEGEGVGVHKCEVQGEQDDFLLFIVTKPEEEANFELMPSALCCKSEPLLDVGVLLGLCFCFRWRRERVATCRRGQIATLPKNAWFADSNSVLGSGAVHIG